MAKVTLSLFIHQINYKMKRIAFIVVIIIGFISSCNDNGLIEKVISSYPNGTPSLIEYYEWQGDNQILVKHIRYYQNGEKKEEGTFTNDNKNGDWKYWYENSNLWSEGAFKQGVRDGETKVYYKSGKLKYTGFYTDGETDKKWIFFDGKGNKIKEVNYDKGNVVNEIEFEE